MLNLDDEGTNGQLFDVHLHYPKKLHKQHNLHNGYARAPENILIKTDMLNTWQQEGYQESSVKKLANYII